MLYRVSFQMEFTGCSVDAAVAGTLASMEAGSGGMIAVDAAGVPVMQFTTGGMFRGYLRSSDPAHPVTQIWSIPLLF